MPENALKLHLFEPRKDAFDRLREKDAFDRVKLPAEESVLMSPQLQRMIRDAVRVQVAAALASLPKPEPSKETVREVRVEVPAKDTRQLVEKSALDAALKKISELEAEHKETRELAERPIIMPGGSGVIGIPPPEGNESKVLTVEGNKAKWKPPTGGSGSGLSGYTVTNGSELKSIDVTDISYDDLCKLVGTIIEDLQ